MPRYKKYYIVLFLIYFITLAANQVGKSELIYWGGDESRHFMNGVFIKDLIADGGWRSPIRYLQWYYLKYPALSVHQYPPLFYLLEALFFSLFGIHVAIIQLLIFSVMAISFFYWYRYLSEKFNPDVALLSLLGFISTSLFLNNFSRIMLDGISVTLILFFMYVLHRWHTSNNRKNLFFALALLMSILGIAFKTYFLLFYFVVFMVYHKLSNKPSRKQWLALLFSFFFIFLLFFTFGTVSPVSPLLYRTLHGVDMMSFYNIKRMIQSRNMEMLFHFDFLDNFGVISILLTAIGMVFITRNKEWGKFSGDILYAANFVFIFAFCLTHFEPERFNIFLLPFFSLLSGYTLYNILKLFRYNLFYIGFVCIIGWYVWKGASYPADYLRGYEKAASDLISLNKENHPILCEAYLDGNFIAYMRKYDSSKQQIIFRGDKLLFSFSLYYRNTREIYVKNEEDIYTLLDLYSIRYIVVDNLVWGIQPKALLRNVLQNTKKFRHLDTYPVSTNLDFQEALLNVYEYVDYNTDYDRTVNISLPVMDTGFSFTINDLRKPVQRFLNQSTQASR